MAVASLMLLICSDYYFTRSMTAQMPQFLSNRCTFVLDAPEDAVRLLKKLESDERVNNIQVILSTNDDITVGSWYDPEEAYINDKLVSGHTPTDADKENWCIVSFAYQQKQEAAENKIPVINDAFILRDGVVCTTIGILRDNSYDVLISQELMTGLLGLYADSMDSLRIQITYLYMDHVSEPQLEELNGEILLLDKEAFLHIQYIPHLRIEQAYAIDLNYAASEPEFGDMLMQYPALILTNDESIAEGQNWSYPNVSLLVKIAEDKRESAISFLSQYGDCISFSEIQKNSLNGFWDEFWQMLFPNIAMMLAVIYGIAGITFLFIHRSRQALAVYEMCGQSAADRRTFILFTNGFPMAVGVMMSFVLSCLKAVKASFYIENIWTIYHVVSTVLLALVFLLVMCFCTNTMLRHTTIANMRRSE